MSERHTTQTAHSPNQLTKMAADAAGVRLLEGGTPQDVLVPFWAQNHVRYCLAAALEFDDTQQVAARTVRLVADRTEAWLADKHDQPAWAINRDLIEAQAAKEFAFRFLFCQSQAEDAIAVSLAEERDTEVVWAADKAEVEAREDAGIDVVLADETVWQVKKEGAKSDDSEVPEIRWDFEGFDSNKIEWWTA